MSFIASFRSGPFHGKVLVDSSSRSRGYRRFVIVKQFFLRYNNFVRLDLFLKTGGLVKRRTIAREMCDFGRVLLNGQQAKPAKEVKQGDVITLKFFSRIIDVEVLDVNAVSSRKSPPDKLFRVKAEKRLPKGKELWNENHS